MKVGNKMTYEEFKETRKEPKYFGNKCFVAGCENPAEYEGGDARFYCGVCEEHAGIKKQYETEIMFNNREKYGFCRGFW